MATETTQQELYAHMAEWRKFLRRHEDNVFNGLFFDKEDITPEEVDKFVYDTAMFFDMPLPQVYDTCDTLAKEISRSGSDYDIFYNEKLLRDAGINNKDAFKLMLTHEVCHHTFRNVIFGLLNNEHWTKELVCDYMAGVRSLMDGFTTGKYKYTISTTKSSMSHPPGWCRKPAFLQGRQTIESLLGNGEYLRIRDVIDDFKDFIIRNKEVIENEWNRYVEHCNDPIPAPKQTRIEDLPDTNLIKQYVLYGKTGLQ